MIELPEAQALAKQLDRTLRGKTVRQVLANSSPHGFAMYFGDPGEYPKLLEGRAVDGARAWSGQVEVALERARLLFSDGANLRYLEPGVPPPKKHQLFITFGDGSALACTVQMYGGLWAFAEGENQSEYYKAAREAVTPLSEAFDGAYFSRLWEKEKPSLSVKALLATGQRIPGLGNGVLQDLLFRARVNPQSRLGALSEEERLSIFSSLKQTLSEMAAGGGRDTEKDLFGNPGGYRTVLSAKTKDFPCPACGGPIVRKAYMGGNVYFCPACQPIKK